MKPKPKTKPAAKKAAKSKAAKTARPRAKSRAVKAVTKAPAKKKPAAKPAAKKKAAALKKAPATRKKKAAAPREPEMAREDEAAVELAAEPEPDETRAELAGEIIEAEGEAGGEPEVTDEGITSLALPESRTIARLSPLQQYLLEVRQHSLLTPEEEQSLARSYFERDDREAGRRLVTGNLRLVVKIALEYYRHWMDLLDLIQEGNLGLVQAVKKFDPYRGIRLSTYSSFWIRAYILKFLMDNWRLVKIGTTQAQRKLFFNLKKEKERLEMLGFKPGARMLAEALDVKESEVVEMEQRLGTRDESLDAPVTDDGKQTRENVLADERPETDSALADEEFAAIIREKMAEFRKRLSAAGNDKELFIFDRRLMAEEPLTLQEVGEKFQVSRERVRQLEARLLRNLKDFLRAAMPDFEDYDFVQ